jgi:uncharacterized protein
MVKNGVLILSFLFFQTIFSQTSADVFDIARKGTVAEAREAVKADPKAFHTVNAEGYSPLILACYRGNAEVAKYLIETGSDINGTSSMGTPLMAAVVKGNTEIVRHLLEKKANPDLSDANGTTALIYAAMFKNPEIIKLLLANKADKTKTDKNGKTAFEYAVFSGNETIINLLK